MRRWTMFALALLVSLGMSDIAHAKKDKKKKGGDETTEQPADDAGGDEAAADEMTIEVTGVADVDSIFEKANAPIENIKTARMKFDSLSTNLTTALGLPAGTPFKDALADLKTKAEGKLELAMDEKGVPSLKPGDGVPENVSTAVDAVNNGISDVMMAVEALAEVPNQVKEVVAAAQSFNPQSLISSGVKPLEAPKVMKKVMGNLNVLGKAPDEVKMLGESVAGLKDDLQASFGGGGE